MERIAVISSNVASMGYDEVEQVLEVEFKGGRVYHYLDVSPEVWAGRADAESIGRWVATVIKPQFEFAPGEFVAPEPDEPEDDEEQDGDCIEHDTVRTFEDETGYQWECQRCGAEGWEDAEEAPSE